MSLNEEQLSKLEKRLRHRFDALREEVRRELVQSDQEQYGVLAGDVADPGDQSTADLLADLNLAVIDRHINEIRAVERALLRIGSGAYGICVDCDEPIGAARLQAQPTATRCSRCQTRHEQGFVQAGHASL